MELSSCKLFIFVLLLPITCCIDDSPAIYQECDKDISNTNNLLQENIERTFYNLLIRTHLYGSATTSHGIGKDTVYGLTMCRGDTSPEACAACIIAAEVMILNICPFSPKAIIVYDVCSFRYSTINFLGELNMSLIDIRLSSDTLENYTDFDQKVGELMGTLKATTASGEKKYGSGESIINSDMTIYGMTQCTHDLQESTCTQCLETLLNTMSTDCKNHLGCQVTCDSCVVRYEINEFLSGPAV